MMPHSGLGMRFRGGRLIHWRDQRALMAELAKAREAAEKAAEEEVEEDGSDGREEQAEASGEV